MGDQMKVRIDGRAMLRPAQPSPTGPFFLSSLDIIWQILHYNQRLIFYEDTQISGAALMQQLRNSLALCLVHYYPWCGRIAKDPLPPHRVFIDCNDAGVEFVEASCVLPLSTFAPGRFQMNPFFLQLSQRPDHKGDSLYHSPLLSIQATLFSDGGLTLGIAQSHIVADGLSLWNFMVSWGECSRGVALSLPPLHDRGRLAVTEVSPEKAKWTLEVAVKEMEDPAVEQSEKDSCCAIVEMRTLSGDKTSRSTGTSSAIPGKPSRSASNVSSSTSSVGKLASTETVSHEDVSTHNVGKGNSADNGYANKKGEEPVRQGSKNNGTARDGNLETVSPTGGGDENSSDSNGDKKSTGGTMAPVRDEPDPDPLVHCLFDLPSLAVKKLKAAAGEGFTSYEVMCAHFWQRVTIARQMLESDPTHFSVVVNCRPRVTPPLSPAYFGNVVTFSVALSTVGNIGSESLCVTTSRIHQIIAKTQEERLVSFMHWLESKNNQLVIEEGRYKRLGKGINVASSPRFPVYQVDFGWGTPIAVRPGKTGGDGELVLFGGRPGSIQGDVEMCTALPDSVLRRLLEDPEFFAKPPGSPYARE